MKTVDDMKQMVRDEMGRFTSPRSSLPMWGMLGAGLLAGLSLGFLLAPQSGADLREKVRDQLGEARDKAQDLLS